MFELGGCVRDRSGVPGRLSGDPGSAPPGHAPELLNGCYEFGLLVDDFVGNGIDNLAEARGPIQNRDEFLSRKFTPAGHSQPG